MSPTGLRAKMLPEESVPDNRLKSQPFYKKHACQPLPKTKYALKTQQVSHPR